ncbi:Alpha/Beta hydrolase protein [Delphinella strobiligena]|nr:Alpha/Beta hydrolase protein [Delphinella strobiligena]
MHHTLAFLCAIAGAIAAPAHEKRAAAPTVTVTNGTIVGSTTGTIDSFSGIPFAQPPVGSLRLKPPQSVISGYSTLTATGVPTSCPQFYTQVDTTDIPSDVIGDLLDTPFVQTVTVEGEDCLTLNVQRPSTATSSSKLPVVVWIFGGGFEFGSTQIYNGDSLVTTSISLGSPVIYVAINYRVSGFGFLAGKEVQADGSTNLGLRDQRLALEWIAENIEAFGGDPTKVTIWGESAGSISVFDQTIINGGDNTHHGQALFRGAIMNSGSIVPALEVSDQKAQDIYDAVVTSAGCSSASDTLACLRTVTYETLLEACNSVPGIFSYSGLNLAYLPRPDPSSNFFSVSPELALDAGDYAKVPVIIGDQEDEGTLFSLVQTNITTNATLISYFASIFPTVPVSTVAGYINTYPDNASAGSPFRTGILNEIRPGFKRLAAVSGDIVFNLKRRQYLDVVSSEVDAWSFLDSHLYGTLVLGTFHASDLLEYFFDVTSPITAITYQTYYVSFINNLNPNTISTAAPLIDWPQYDTSDRQLLHLNALDNELLADTYRNDSYAFLVENPSTFRV